MTPFAAGGVVPQSEGRGAVASVSVETCPECGAVLPPGRLDEHLRGEHRLYRFRGTAAPAGATLAALLAALSQPEPDPDAYALLELIAHDEHGRRAAGFLASTLGAALAAAGGARRAAVCDALARGLAGRPGAAAVAWYLAAEPAVAPRQLALTLAVRLPPPVERKLIRALRPLLRDRRLPAESQIAAAAALLNSTGRAGAPARRLLRALVAGRSKVRSVARLRQLGALVGTFPVLEEVIRGLEDRIRMRCPRCDVQMRRREMVQHLWHEHRLLLHGERVREPWQLIEEWVEAGVRQDDDAAVERARDLAQQIDPQEGPRRVQRLVAARGGKGAETGRALLAEAAEQQASLCPHCYGLVAVRGEEPPRPPSLWRGRLSARGYRIELSEDGLVPAAEVETPAGPLACLPASRRHWTQKGAMLFLVTPLVLLALALALVSPGGRSLLPVTTLLGLALGTYLAVCVAWRPRRPMADRVVDYAWTAVAPRLHAEGFSLEDSAFLASLALASVGRGRPAARRPALARLLALTERVVGAGFGGARDLAALRRLAIADAVRQGKDRVLLVVAEVDSCFSGRLPLAYAEGVLAGWRQDGWGRGDQARLRVLLCDSAFEAGFELRDLIEAGETAGALGEVLDVEDTEGLAHLRLLWSLRASRPWDRVGSADSVFDLAADPGEADLLGRYPDLLLRHKLPPRFATEAVGGAAHVLVCSRGVVLRGTVFTRPPRAVTVTARQGRFEMVVDGQRFQFGNDPEPVASRLERWCRYYFDEFVPAAGDVHRWRSPDATAVLRAWGTVRCPDCGRSLLPRVGEVGVPLEAE
jgi:hypothetical protein